MKVKTKLMGLGLIGILFALLIGAGGYWGGQNMANAMVNSEVSMKSLRNHMQSDMMHEGLRADVLNALLTAARKNKDSQSFVLAEHAAHVKSFRQALDENKSLPLNAEIAAALGNTRPLVDSYINESEALVLLAFKNTDAAEAKLPAFQDTFAKLEKELGAISDLIEKNIGKAKDKAEAAWVLFNWAILAICALAVCIEIMAVYLIVKSLLGQLGGEPADATEIATRISRGDLATVIAIRPNDSTSLLAAMATMQRSLKAFVAAQQQMAQQHGAGLISEKIAVEQFPGVYGQMADSINKLAASHIDETMKVVDIVSRYAQGDLSVDMDKLPGEKAKITDAIDGVKSSLRSINGDIAKLVEAAVKGDFTARGDADKYQHDFKKMVDGLNRLMQVSDTGLNEVVRVLGALAKGDLTEKITNDYQGTWGRMKEDANQTVDRLTEIVSQIKESTESINVASKEIAAGNTDLSSRTEEQASSLEETASSMEELTSTVKQNAENARQANQLAIGASDVAVKGGAVVSQVVTTMSSINESSKKIVDIISVIDGIAFQTNILALNAAVEAARAGEQGRGFAVVATEVRNLAQRSAAAAKEIKELIGDSVEKVGAGTKLVDEAGKTMEEIVNSVKRVTDIMAEITAASQEQSTGIEQVNQAITQMDEVTQQNAALVEQAAAAAESLEEQAEVLAQAVGVFKLDARTQTNASAQTNRVAERRDTSTRPLNVARLPQARRGSVAVKSPATRSKVAGGADDWSEF
jgi:methyl-accepting chemotaxis protein